MSKFNWAGLGVAILAGALGMGGTAAVSHNLAAAGPAAAMGGLLSGLLFAQHPNQPTQIGQLAATAQQLAGAEINNLVQHNSAVLGPLAGIAQNAATAIVDSALTPAGTNATVAPSAIPINPPKPTPLPQPPSPKVIVDKSAIQAQIAALEAQLAAAPADDGAPSDSPAAFQAPGS